MQTIFILIKCELGRTYDVASAIMEDIERTRVSEIFSISGQFDLLAKFYLDDQIDVGQFVNDRIHSFSGIKDTQTMMTWKAFH